MWRKSLQPPQKVFWWPLVCTLISGFIFLDPYQRGARRVEWVLTGLAALTFVGLFAYGLAVVARQRRLPSLLTIAAIAVIGLILAPFNSGAAIFVTFATAMAPFAVTGEIALSATIIGVILATVALETWLVRLPWQFLTFSSIYAIVLGTANTYAARHVFSAERLAKADERERIARDLHDVLGHTLSLIVLKAELARRLIDRDPARARHEILELEAAARAALADVRQTISGYLAGGVAAEIERAQATLGTAGVKVSVDVDTLAMNAAQERVLALVLREATTNVVRHARAARCRVSLHGVDGGCRLEVEDDGVGGTHLEGEGLRGMRGRVEALGGTLSRSTAVGTRLTITLPLASSDGSRT